MAKYTGTNGNDNKVSGSEADVMLGLLGDDTLDGAGNRDTIDGGGGNDSLIGGDRNDSLIGGDGKDGLCFGNGMDTLIGGAGADSYHRGIATVTEGDAADVIVGFEIGAGGDVVDLGDFFSDPLIAADVLANPNDYVQAQMVDGNTVIRIDLDGTGGASAFFDLCVIQGVSTDLNGLLYQGNLVLAQPEIVIEL